MADPKAIPPLSAHRLSRLPKRPKPKPKPKLSTKMGRKKIPLDWEAIGQRIAKGATTAGIVAELDCSRETLYKRCKSECGLDYSRFQAKYRAKGDDSLRIKQYEVAIDGNVPMLIWLGKQRLGQRENITFEHLNEVITTVNLLLSQNVAPQAILATLAATIKPHEVKQLIAAVPALSEALDDEAITGSEADDVVDAEVVDVVDAEVIENSEIVDAGEG